MKLLKNVFGRDNALIIENYPYGFNQKTKMFIWLEKNKRGYRVGRATINPSTGKENKPKYSTYSTYIRLIEDESGYIKTYAYNSYSVEDFLKAKRLGIFEDKEEEKQLEKIQTILTIKSLAIYGGYDFNLIKDFNILDLEELDKRKEKKDINYINQFKTEEGKDPNYSPFKITTL